MSKDNRIIALEVIILIVFVLLALSSCSSVKKNLSLQVRQVDSTGESHTKTNDVKKRDSVGETSTNNVHLHDSSGGRALDIQATFADDATDSLKGGSTGAWADNTITGKINPDGTFSLNPGKHKLKDLNIKSSTTGNVKDSSAGGTQTKVDVKTIDSSQQVMDNKATLVEKVKQKTKEVDKKGLRWGSVLFLGAVVTALVIGAIFLRLHYSQVKKAANEGEQIVKDLFKPKQ